MGSSILCTGAIDGHKCRWVALVITFAASCAAGPTAQGDEAVEYFAQVKPLLEHRCFSCHGALENEAGLRLDAGELIRIGGDSGAVVVPGRSQESLLISRVSATGAERMPPEGEGDALTAEEIGVLSRWIDQGATIDGDDPIPADPRAHWAFQLPRRVSPTASPPSSRMGNLIDAYLSASQHERGIEPRPPASREVLLRRVTLDLTGLPPTREQLHAFLADSSATAYDDLVDRLLADPAYGERWGRHWMDVWRYTDWFGLGQDVRYSQKHIWHWRDWIVESLNADKGYDRMIVEMLAADELAPADLDMVRATGFLSRNWYLFNRNFWLDDVVNHTSKAFLGLTLNCARCHDHKYDPIGQQAYYQMRAFFEPHGVRYEPVAGQVDIEQDAIPRVFDKELAAETFLFIRGNEESPDKSRSLGPAVPAVLALSDLKMEPVQLPLRAYYPALRPEIQQTALAAAVNAVVVTEKATRELEAELAQLDSAPTAGTTPLSPEAAQSKRTASRKLEKHARARLESLRARQAAENAKYAKPKLENLAQLAQDAARSERLERVAEVEMQLLDRQQQADRATKNAAASPQDEALKTAAATADTNVRETMAELDAARAAVGTATTEYSPLGEVYPSKSSGRRLALARWIASPSNPLTARVAVNHIWTRHFGSPLVGSMFDFGLRTPQPLHHELLDALAVEFMESGWSMRRLHRLIVTSQAYQRSSSAGSADNPNLQVDPDNLCYWKMNSRRLEGEVIRDTLLALSGRLDRTQGGAELPVADAAAGNRRTIYYRYARDDRVKFLEAFDAPSVEECYRRSESIVPQQALAMVNSSLALKGSVDVAAYIEVNAGGGDSVAECTEFITQAFERVLTRAPGPEERTAAEEFLEASAALTDEPDRWQRARAALVLVLINHNDFVTVR